MKKIINTIIVLVCVLMGTHTTFAETTVQLPNGRKIICSFDTRTLSKEQIIEMDANYASQVKTFTGADTVAFRNGLLMDYYDVQNTYSKLMGKEDCNNTTLYTGIENVVEHNPYNYVWWLQRYLLCIMFLAGIIGNIVYFIPVIKSQTGICTFLSVVLTMYLPLWIMYLATRDRTMSQLDLRMFAIYFIAIIASVLLNVQLADRKLQIA